MGDTPPQADMHQTPPAPQGDGPAAAPKSDEIKQQAAAAAQLAEEYLSGWKRAKADYVNLKRESEARSWQQAKTAVSSFAYSLWTDFYCNAVLTLGHIPADQQKLSWVEGLRNSMKQFEAVLKRLGFEPVRPKVGEPFDPLQHEAVAADALPGNPADTILEVVRPGLKAADDGSVVVPARVKVSKE